MGLKILKLRLKIKLNCYNNFDYYYSIIFISIDQGYYHIFIALCKEKEKKF